MIQTTQEWFTPEERMPECGELVLFWAIGLANVTFLYHGMFNGENFEVEYLICAEPKRVPFWSYPVIPKEPER